MVEIKRPEMAIEIAVQNPHFIFLMGGDGKLLKSLKLSRTSKCNFCRVVDA
jgi:hypothetical protein